MFIKPRSSREEWGGGSILRYRVLPSSYKDHSNQSLYLSLSSASAKNVFENQQTPLQKHRPKPNNDRYTCELMRSIDLHHSLRCLKNDLPVAVRLGGKCCICEVIGKPRQQYIVPRPAPLLLCHGRACCLIAKTNGTHMEQINPSTADRYRVCHTPGYIVSLRTMMFSNSTFSRSEVVHSRRKSTPI